MNRQPDLFQPDRRLITVDVDPDAFLTLCADKGIQILRFGRIGNTARYRVEYVETGGSNTRPTRAPMADP